MANEQNLRPRTTLSKEEAKKMGSKGGKASAKKKRERKAMKEAINLLLSQPCNIKDSEGKDFKAFAKQFGIDEKDVDNQMAILISMFRVALSGNKSSVSAATFLRDTVGDKPVENVNTNVNVETKKSAIDDIISQMKSVDE